MAQDATQTGADKPARNSRTEMYNIIAEKRIDEFNKELKEGGSEDQLAFVATPFANDDEDADPDDAAAEAERKRLETQAAATGVRGGDGTPPVEGEGEAAPIYEFLGEEDIGKTKIKIKVDGQEQEMAVADLVRDAQKNKAADKRLQEASLAKQRADELAAETVRRANAEAEDIIARAKTGQGNAAEGHDAGNGSPSTSDAIKNAVALIYEGDQDKAAAELEKIITGSRRGEDATTTRALKDQLKTEFAWDSALAQFSADHKDICSDPHLLGMWQKQLDLAAASSSTPQEAIEKATSYVDDWLETKVSGRQGGTGVTVEGEALQRRAAGKNEANKHVTSSSTSQRAPRAARAEEKPLSPSEIIAEMKRQRGQVP